MKEFEKGKWYQDSDLYIAGMVTYKTPSLGPAGLCWDRTTYQLAQVYLENFRPFYMNDSALFPALLGLATPGEPFFITKDGNPINSKKVSGRLRTMASILHPDLKGKMSRKPVRKSAVTHFQNLQGAVTSSISNHNLAQDMLHSDVTADRFYNLLDIV